MRVVSAKFHEGETGGQRKAKPCLKAQSGTSQGSATTQGTPPRRGSAAACDLGDHGSIVLSQDCRRTCPQRGLSKRFLCVRVQKLAANLSDWARPVSSLELCRHNQFLQLSAETVLFTSRQLRASPSSSPVEHARYTMQASDPFSTTGCLRYGRILNPSLSL